jgi:hypothetical protein
VNFAAITLFVASQRVFIVVAFVVVDFVIDLVRKLLNTTVYIEEYFKFVVQWATCCF